MARYRLRTDLGTGAATDRAVRTSDHRSIPPQRPASPASSTADSTADAGRSLTPPSLADRYASSMPPLSTPLRTRHSGKRGDSKDRNRRGRPSIYEVLLGGSSHPGQVQDR